MHCLARRDMTNFVLIKEESVLDIIKSVEPDFLQKLKEAGSEFDENLAIYDEIVACLFGQKCSLISISSARIILEKLWKLKPDLLFQNIVPNMSQSCKNRLSPLVENLSAMRDSLSGPAVHGHRINLDYWND